MKRAWFILSLAGCNQVFSLEPTISLDAAAPADLDGDGIPNEDDNCLTVPNATQADRDQDGFGDDCDTCPDKASASTHDEDGDRIGDDCDLCPGLPDFRDDTDDDGVGDLCDEHPLGPPKSQRLLFEPFVATPAGLQSDTTHWTVSQDAIAPDVPLQAGDNGLRMTIQTPLVWAAYFGMESAALWQDGDQFGFVAKSASHTASCIATCAMATGCIAKLTIDGLTTTTWYVIPAPFVRSSFVASIGGQVNCGLAGTGPFASAVPTDGMTISIIASPNLRPTYFEYIQ